jgi:hypothetical protein
LPERKRWRAGGDEQKICTFGYTNTTHWNEDFRYAPALILFQKSPFSASSRKSVEWCGGLLLCAAQAIPSTCHTTGVIDAEIAAKGHLWKATN